VHPHVLHPEHPAGAARRHRGQHPFAAAGHPEPADAGWLEPGLAGAVLSWPWPSRPVRVGAGERLSGPAGAAGQGGVLAVVAGTDSAAW